MSLDVRRISQVAAVHECPTAAIMFRYEIDPSLLIKDTSFERENKQSGFAFARGNHFESRLHENNSDKLVDVHHRNGIVSQNCRVINLRTRHKKNAVGIIGRKNDTEQLLKQVRINNIDGPLLVVGPVFQYEISNRTIYLEADFLLFQPSGEIFKIYVGEIKSFPVIDNRVQDARSLGEAQDQMAVYLVAIKQKLKQLEIISEISISDEGLLVTPHNTTQNPHLSQIPLTVRVKQMEERLQRLADMMAEQSLLPNGISFERIADLSRSPDERLADLEVLTTQVGTHYTNHCNRACPLSPYCRHVAHQKHLPTLGGSKVKRQLSGVNSMERAIALANGENPLPQEQAVAKQLQFEAQLFAMLTLQNRQEEVA